MQHTQRVANVNASCVDVMVRPDKDSRNRIFADVIGEDSVWLALAG